MARAPRVLHLISSLRVGGAERLLVSSMRAAGSGAGFSVIIMNDECDAGLLAELTASGVPVHCLNRPEGHLHPSYLRSILRIIDAEGIDVLHTHNEGSRSWGMLVRLLRPRLKLVYTVHAEGIGASITGLKRAAYLRLVDATVAISPAVEEECRAFGARLIRRIENGVDVAAFAVARRERNGNRLPRLINVARFQHIKGQDILLGALRLCHDRGLPLPLTLAGAGGTSPFLADLRQQVARLGLEDHVTFAVDRTDVPALLAEGDIFVLPSRQEGFGLVLIEAMAAGLPVIASRTGGPANLIAEDINGRTFTPENPAELAERIIALAGNADDQARLAQAGTATAARFDISGTLAAHQQLYSELAA